VFFILLILVIISWDTIKRQLVIGTIVQRGLIVQNCFWWKISDLFLEDGSGVHLYNNLKPYGPFVQLYVGTHRPYLVTDVNYIKTILDNSPFLFGVGKYKYAFFRSFMKDNLGVSQGCPWKYRRKINEFVLDSNNAHKFYLKFTDGVNQLLLSNPNPSKYQDFVTLSKKMTGLVVFNRQNVPSSVFDIFTEANTIRAVFLNINLPSKKVYVDYLQQQINNPRPNSLVYLGKETGASDHELLHQIPHWIFPLAGLYANAVPRALLLICSDPKVYSKAIQGNYKYLRNCMLESFRLNNPVVTMFKTLLQDYCFSEKYCFKKGTQFVILTNPVMREKEFVNPNAFIPERWTKKRETDYSSLMFSQGPQKCPGKELALDLSVHLLRMLLPRIKSCYPQIDTLNVPQMINPCTIQFGY
jgi:hypothetical protein